MIQLNKNITRRFNMKYLFLTILLALAAPVLATNNNPLNECGNHGNNCGGNDIPPVGNDVEQSQEQSQSATATAGAIAVSGSSSSSTNTNTNNNTATGGSVNDSGNSSSTSNATGGAGGSATQGQSSENDNSNSSNNSASQNVNIAGDNNVGDHEDKYGNNVAALAPNIYSSSACTAGGLSGAASALGVGVSLGGAKQDPQCQIRENARIIAGMYPELAMEYLCKNPGIDVGAVLGAACLPKVVEPVAAPAPVVEPVPVVDDRIRG